MHFKGCLSWRALAVLAAVVSGAATTTAQTFSHELRPLAGWAQGLKNPVIALDGSGQPVPAMSEISTYLHGRWMAGGSWDSKTVTFSLTTPADGVAGIEIDQVSTAGHNGLAIAVDGYEVLREPVTAPVTFEISLSAGAHVVTFASTGDDWVNVARYFFRSGPLLAEPGRVTSFSWGAPTVATYAKAEGTFTVDRDYLNPYNPNEVTVDAIVTGPEGQAFSMPAFWWEEVTWEQQPVGTFALFNAPVAGSGCWKVRLALPTPGTWSVVIHVQDAGGTSTSDPQTIEVTEGDSQGFVRMDPSDRQGFRFDGGAPYIPIGFNLCWNDGSLGTFYDDYYGRMQENGANWMRYWFVPFARQALEWSPLDWLPPYTGFYSGLGRYSQEAAAFNDYVIEQAEAHGIYMQVVLERMTQYSTTLDEGRDWGNCPFNVANGGWLTEPAAWFTDARSIEMVERRYRYIVARWGYSTHVLAWELFNEVNYSDGTAEDKASWHRAMSSYLKTIDPYRHLVTTSSTRAELAHLDDHPDMDLLEEHLYADPIAAQLGALDVAMLQDFTKPVLVGEFGSHGSDQDSLYFDGHPDIWGDHVRQASWIGSMNRVPNMHWFWDYYLEQYDLFGLYRPLTQFWQGEDPGRQLGLGSATFSFSGAPSNPFGLPLAPGANWAGGQVNPSITVASDGSTTPGMGDVSWFLCGDWHPDLTQRVTFDITTERAGKVGLTVGSVGSGTEVVRILVDGAEQGRLTFTAAGSFEVDMSAGHHTVVFESVGQDWVSVTSYYFRGFDVGAVTRAYGFKSNEAVYAYVLDQGFGEWAATAETRTGISLNVESIPGGTWDATFVHPVTGAIEAGPALTPVAGRIAVPLPDFSKDLAVKLVRRRVDPALQENRLHDISLRAPAGTGANVCIAGFYISGGQGNVLLRAAGPALRGLGVADASNDPNLILYSGGSPIGDNDSWGSAATSPDVFAAASRLWAFSFADGSADAATVAVLPAGGYTMHALDADGDGVLLAEVYDARVDPAAGGGRIGNLSGRVFVGTGEQIGIAGFIVAGNWPRTVLIRAVGPGLVPHGVEGVLADPHITLLSGATPIGENDDWGTAATSPMLAAATARCYAFPLADGSKDAAMIAQLDSGEFTVHVSGADGGTGIALIEIYDLVDEAF